MKARIRATGEIVKLAEYAKITLDMCDSYGNPIELKPEDVELISDDKGDSSTTDWNQVRVQASIAAMQAQLTNPEILECVTSYDLIDGTASEKVAKMAVKYAHALVEELKKEGIEYVLDNLI